MIIYKDVIWIDVEWYVTDILVHLANEITVNFIKIRLHHVELIANLGENIAPT